MLLNLMSTSCVYFCRSVGFFAIAVSLIFTVSLSFGGGDLKGRALKVIQTMDMYLLSNKRHTDSYFNLFSKRLVFSFTEITVGPNINVKNDMLQLTFKQFRDRFSLSKMRDVRIHKIIVVDLKIFTMPGNRVLILRNSHHDRLNVKHNKVYSVNLTEKFFLTYENGELRITVYSVVSQLITKRGKSKSDWNFYSQ